MSHLKERVAKDCLNCGAGLTGRYCQVCGQENTEPRETVWGLVSHFFNDITHFDGKFFSSVKYLIIKPGFLSAEYIKGRRASYLHPIRMYVFTSAFFFIIFFSLFNVGKLIPEKKDLAAELKELKEAQADLKSIAAKTNDSITQLAILRSISNIEKHTARLAPELEEKRKNDSAALAVATPALDTLETELPALKGLGKKIEANAANHDSADIVVMDLSSGTKANIRGLKYGSQLAYDSVQKELPEARRDGWFETALSHKAIMLNEKAKGNKREAFSLLLEKFLHTLPQVLFISLPGFALLLLILYARRKFYYVDHGIFTIHLYCATFIMLLFIFGIQKLKGAVGWGWLGYLNGILVLGIFFYLYKAMRNFYKQSRVKTIFKFILLLLGAFTMVMFLTAMFFLLSFIQYS